MKKILLPVIAFLTLTGAGCALNNQSTGTAATPVPASAGSQTGTAQAKETEIKYFVSADQPTKYCNGADMDGVAFKNALVKEVTTTVPGVLSEQDKIIATLRMAATAEGWNNTYTRTDSTTFDNGVATLRPAGGWAGVSIFMCAWQPFAEKQLSQFPEITQIKWEEYLE